MNRFILAFFLLCLLNLTLVFGQTFSKVGCVQPYEALSLDTMEGQLMYMRGGDYICGDSIVGIMLWDDSVWKQFGNYSFDKCAGFLKDVIYYKNELYAAGSFCINRQPDLLRGIVKWSNNEWDSVGGGLTGTIQSAINCMAVFQGELYVAGKFTEIDGKPAKNIAKWDGQKWTVIPGVQSDFTSVNAMVVYKDELYVAGHFWYAGTQPAAFIARWTGSSWKVLQNGVNNVVTSMVVDSVDNMLYVAGYFGVIDNQYSGMIARWDGDAWHPVGEGNFFSNSLVNSLAMYNGYLFAGLLNPLNNNSDSVLSRWDGKKWEPVIGPNEGVTHLATYKDKLYIAGFFTKIGNDSISYLASYYDTSSTIITTGIDGKNYNRKELKLYPNPSSELLKIDSKVKLNKIEIYSIEGKRIQVLPGVDSIDISSLDKGIYVLKAFDGNKWFVDRFYKY